MAEDKDNIHNITLGEIDQGDLILHANRELAKIVKDIADPNKVATAKRQLNIVIEFKPDKRRTAASVKYTVTSKPATHIANESDIYIGKDPATGEAIAKPYVPNQQRMPFKESDDQIGDEKPAN